jgi:hypothetical protein
MDKKSTEILSRKMGIWISIIGVVIFMFNFITYNLWEIDIDVLGAIIFILGLIIIIACGKTMKKSSALLSRRNGVWLCIIAAIEALITGYLPINSDPWGIPGLIIFILGIMLIIIRWKH